MTLEEAIVNNAENSGRVDLAAGASVQSVGDLILFADVRYQTNIADFKAEAFSATAGATVVW